MSVIEIGILCCGSIEEEVIYVREILFVDYIFFKLVLMRLVYFIYQELDGDYLVYFMGK